MIARIDWKATGAEIRRQRRWMDYTQAQLGQMVGVRANTVHKWERGTAPTTLHLLRIADALNMYVEDMVKYEEGAADEE